MPVAAFDGTNYYLITGSPAQFTAAGATWQLRTDGVSIAAGPVKTYIATTGALQPTRSSSAPRRSISAGRPTSPRSTGRTITRSPTTHSPTPPAARPSRLSGNIAVHEGNSYEIYSNLGQGDYFEVPGGKTYFVNVAVADTGTATGTIYQVFPISGGAFTIPLQYTIIGLGQQP